MDPVVVPASLAQAGSLQPPPFVFGALAPELLLVGLALLLLLQAVEDGPGRDAPDGRLPARSVTGRRVLAGVATAILAGLGIWLLGRGFATPGATLVGVGAAVLATAIGFEGRPGLAHAWLAWAGLMGGLVLTAWQWVAIYQPEGARTFLAGAVAVDGVALYVRGIVLVTALLVLPIGHGYLTDRGIYRPEVEPLLLLSVVGMTILGAAGDLLVVVIAIELLSFPLYLLAGLARHDRRSQEASIKYFLLGAVASAVLLYGVALLYTATGTIDLGRLADGLALVTTPTRVALLGIALVTVGIGFKAAAVPFHFWTPDVYQGSPTSVTAFMAAGTKAAAFAAFLRLYPFAFGRLETAWVPVLAGVAAVTMMLGALAAIVQRDVKRVLAYSSIAHVGYALVGVTSASAQGVSSTLYYLLAYAVTVLGAFGCVVAIERRRRGEVALVDLKGLGQRTPALAGAFGLCLLSLAGLPATAGFTGKFAVFRAGVNADLTWLVVVGVASSVIAAFFYLRLIAAMFLEEPAEGVGVAPVLSAGLKTAIAAAVAGVVVLGIQPEILITLADQAAVIAR